MIDNHLIMSFTIRKSYIFYYKMKCDYFYIQQNSRIDESHNIYKSATITITIVETEKKDDVVEKTLALVVIENNNGNVLNIYAHISISAVHE